MSKKFLTSMKFLVKDSDPLAAHLGDTYFNSTDKSLRIYNGDYWVTIVKSDDPAPFYMHTHNYNGDVDAVMPVALTVEQIGQEGLLEADGGTPSQGPTEYPRVDNHLDGGLVNN